MIGIIFLTFVAFCGQRIDNLLLSYLTGNLFCFVFFVFRIIKFKVILVALSVCLTPGVRNRQLIPLIRQHIIDFWNNKKSTATSTPNGSIRNSTPTTTILRSSVNQPTYALYSTPSYGSNKTKAQ